MLNLLEKFIYFFLFLLNKYLNLQTTENWLSRFEDKMINKYLSKKEIVAKIGKGKNLNQETEDRSRGYHVDGICVTMVMRPDTLDKRQLF